MRAPSLARSKPVKRLSMLPVRSRNSTSSRTERRMVGMGFTSFLLRFCASVRLYRAGPTRDPGSFDNLLQQHSPGQNPRRPGNKSPAHHAVLGLSHQATAWSMSSEAARSLKRRRARKPDRFSRSTKRVQRTACTPGSWMGCQRLSVKKASRRAGMKMWSI